MSGNCTRGRGHAAHGSSFLALGGHGADFGAFCARKNDIVLAAICLLSQSGSEALSACCAYRNTE